MNSVDGRDEGQNNVKQKRFLGSVCLVHEDKNIVYSRIRLRNSVKLDVDS